MSFHISFTARSVSSAKTKLQAEYAPGAVKALIEKALDALPPAALPSAKHEEPSPHGGSQSSVNHSGMATSTKRTPEFIGVLVEAWGHIGDPGDHSKSSIDRFVVQPIWE